jgi:CMP-N-acetylneuraminic acid synthetase
MTKKISAKVEMYQNDQGEQKGRYVNIGVILNNDSGDFILLDPTVNLSGVLQKQNAMNNAAGKRIGHSVMCSIFDDSKQQSQQNYQQNNNQFQQANNQQQPQQQSQQAPQNNAGEFDPDIPF